jgi:hypothetical protein
MGGSVSSARLSSKDMLKSMPADFFIENAGQLSNQDVRFYTTSGEMQVGFAESAVLIKMVERPSAPGVKSQTDLEPLRSPSLTPRPSRGVLLRLNFEGANRVIPEGKDPLPHPTNFFIGNDPSRWRTNVRSYREVVYEGLYEGVDLIYRTTDEGVKYDFVIAPGADLGIIRMSYEGADSAKLGAAGNLLVHTVVGVIGDSSPIAYQGNEEVQCSFVFYDSSSYGFVCHGLDDAREVVIDPLVYATYLGGGDLDSGYSIATDSVGNAYVTGWTGSTEFPATLGAYDSTLSGESDAFVTKLNSAGGSLLYSTYLGGGGYDTGWSIATDSAGNAYVTGYTYSADFPITPGAIDSILNGSQDTFVAKLDSTGSSLLYSTYLGGDDFDEGYSIAVNPGGSACVTGSTYSADFPVTSGAIDSILNGSQDTFVAKLDSTGSSLLYSTYLGGDSDDVGFSIATDTAGNAYVTGYTDSTDFPVTPDAFDMSLDGTEDAFVAKLDSTGGSLLYSTYLGGGRYDVGFSIATDTAGNAYVTGYTYSADFPATHGAFDTTLNGRYDSFVAKVDSTGGSLLYSTYLGGGGGEEGDSVAIDSTGNAFVTGHTVSADFPATPGAFDITLNGPDDTFVSKLDATGSSLLYSTYLGGGGSDWGKSIALDLDGNAYVTGFSNSVDFPASPDAFDTTFNGAQDPFVAKLNLVNTPPTTDFLSQYWWLVVVIVAVVIVLLMLALMRRRKPKEEAQTSAQRIPPPSEKPREDEEES